MVKSGRGTAALEHRLAEVRSRFGDDHRETLVAMNELAIAYEDEGDVEKARDTQRVLLSTCQRVRGPEHESTTYSMRMLGIYLIKAGELEEARDLQERLVAIEERQFGPDSDRGLATSGTLSTPCG